MMDVNLSKKEDEILEYDPLCCLIFEFDEKIIEKHFFRFIISWWTKLKQFVQDFLREYKEVVILDQRQKGGRQMVEALRTAQPNTNTMSEIENMDKVALGITEDGEIGKVAIFHADEVQQQDGYDVAAERNNGIIRING